MKTRRSKRRNPQRVLKEATWLIERMWMRIRIMRSDIRLIQISFNRAR